MIAEDASTPKNDTHDTTDSFIKTIQKFCDFSFFPSVFSFCFFQNSHKRTRELPQLKSCKFSKLNYTCVVKNGLKNLDVYFLSQLSKDYDVKFFNLVLLMNRIHEMINCS